MALCERCDHDNPAARDYCARCNWYLRWELTGPQALTEPRGGTVEPAVPAGTTPVSLGLPGRRRGPDDPVEVALSPGGELTLVGRVRNGGATAPRFDVTVEGLPESWWSVEPPALHAPFGECEVEVRLHPPRSALAGGPRWPFW